MERKEFKRVIALLPKDAKMKDLAAFINSFY